MVFKMKIYLQLILTVVLISGCGSSDESRRKMSDFIPDGHPAYLFYELSSKGPVTDDFCISSGGDIIPMKKGISKEYKIKEKIKQGVQIIEEIDTKRLYFTVSYIEGEIIQHQSACVWKDIKVKS